MLIAYDGFLGDAMTLVTMSRSLHDHRQLDLFGGAGHRHSAQIRRTVLAIVASSEVVWDKPAAVRMRVLHCNAVGIKRIRRS